jgi:hypothetical protein
MQVQHRFAQLLGGEFVVRQRAACLDLDQIGTTQRGGGTEHQEATIPYGEPGPAPDHRCEHLGSQLVTVPAAAPRPISHAPLSQNTAGLRVPTGLS